MGFFNPSLWGCSFFLSFLRSGGLRIERGAKGRAGIAVMIKWGSRMSKGSSSRSSNQFHIRPGSRINACLCSQSSSGCDFCWLGQARLGVGGWISKSGEEDWVWSSIDCPSAKVARPLSVFLHRSSASFNPVRGALGVSKGLGRIASLRPDGFDVPLIWGGLMEGSLTNLRRFWAFFRRDSAAARRWWFYGFSDSPCRWLDALEGSCFILSCAFDCWTNSRAHTKWSEDIDAEMSSKSKRTDHVKIVGKTIRPN